MGRLDFKLVVVILALVLLVMLIDVDASRRRRRASFSRRRRSSYGSSRSTSSSSSGLVTGLSIFGAILFVAVVGFVIGYCCCRSNRSNATGSILSTQPEVQYQREDQARGAGQPPPYSASANEAYPYPTKDGTYPPPGDTNIYPPVKSAAVLPYPPATYPPSDSAMGNSPMYPPPGNSGAAYPPAQAVQSPQEIQPPQGMQAQEGTVPLFQLTPSGQESVSLHPPSYDDALKESQPRV